MPRRKSDLYTVETPKGKDLERLAAKDFGPYDSHSGPFDRPVSFLPAKRTDYILPDLLRSICKAVA